MSDDNKRIIDYDAFNELPPNSWLVVDSEGQGTGKIAPIKIGATYEIQDGAHSFTLVGSNGYTHTVDIPYDSVQMSYSDYDALTELEKMDGTNRFVPDCPTTELEPEIWQRVGRDPLTTDEKTVSKAINELDSRSKAVNGDAFSELVEYSKGDYCIYDNAMYTYIADTPSTGSWDASKWELTDIQTEFTSIKSNLMQKPQMLLNDNPNRLNTIIMPLILGQVSFSSGVATVNLSSHVPTGYMFSSMAFAQAEDTGTIAITGCLINASTSVATIKTSNQSFTGQTAINMICFLYES